MRSQCLLLILVCLLRYSETRPIFEFNSYIRDEFRILRSNGPYVLGLAFFPISSAPLIGVGCQDEVGLTDGSRQYVVFSEVDRLRSAVRVIINATLTNRSPWRNSTHLNSGYRYANATELVSPGRYYSVVCYGGPSAAYEYLYLKTHPIQGVRGFFNSIDQAPSFQQELTTTVPNAFFLDGNQALNIVSLNTDYDIISDTPSMRGTEFTTSLSVNVTALGLEIVGSIGSRVQVGLWKTGDISVIAVAVVNQSSPVRGGYVYGALQQPVTLEAGTSYRVAAMVGSNHQYYQHQKLLPRSSLSSCVTFTNGVYTTTSVFGYPGFSTTDLKYSCVNIDVSGPPKCGDGVRLCYEECDDGNLNNGDGCSATCMVEEFFVCNDEVMSICTSRRTTTLGDSQRGETDSTSYLRWLIPLVTIIPIVMIIVAVVAVASLIARKKKKIRSLSHVVMEVGTTAEVTRESILAAICNGNASDVLSTPSYIHEISNSNSVLLKSTTGEFTVSNQTLGDNALGAVRMGVDSKGLLVAVKTVPVGTCGDEIAVLQGFVHPNIITLRGISSDSLHTYIVMEYATGGSLANMIQAFGQLRLSDAKRFSKDILTGLLALHEKNILHRNIKPRNVLYMAGGVAKLVDATLKSTHSNVRYTPPEVARGEPYTAASDIWSVGIVIVEMTTGQKAKRFTRDILQGLAALHDKGIVHRDIKPGNVLYTGDGVAKLADFGIVSATDKTMTSDKGTLRYMAPEAIKGERLTTQVDIWAVGLTLIEMLSGYRPWHTIKEDYGVVAHLHGSNENSEYPFPEDIPMDAREFISKMLHFNPKARSTAHNLVSDKYLQS